MTNQLYRVHWTSGNEHKGSFMSPPMSLEEANEMLARLELDPDIVEPYIELA